MLKAPSALMSLPRARPAHRTGHLVLRRPLSCPVLEVSLNRWLAGF